jgi:hypothetical protein
MAVTRAKDLKALEAKLAKLRRSAIRSDRAERVRQLEKQIERAKALLAKEAAARLKRTSSLTASFKRSAERIQARAQAREEQAKARRAAAADRRAKRAERLQNQINKAGG